MKKFLIAIIGSLFLTGGTAWADQVIADDVIIQGDTCVGTICVDGETFALTTIVKLKSGNTPTLRLEQDNSGGFAPQTWDVSANEEGFGIFDVTNGFGIPSFGIETGAPDASFIISSSGNIGIGTIAPEFLLHVLASPGGATPKMLFENPDAIAGNQKWFFDVKDGSGR